MVDELENIPGRGFYYHYKHDPEGPFNDYAYEVLGVGHHTEDDCVPEDRYMVIYRPLYEGARVYEEGKLFDMRPLRMFTEYVTKQGKTFPRFKRIDDEELIGKLEAQRAKMYGAA